MNNEFFISKLSFTPDQQLIDKVWGYESDGKVLSSGIEYTRPTLVSKKLAGEKISIIKKQADGIWQRGNEFTYNNIFSWGETLPQHIPRRNTFVSYYHNDDQLYRNEFENRFGDLIISQSVKSGEILPDNSDQYIKRLIHDGYLCDTTVLVVLIGPKTRCRKHVDWEISGALNYKVGDRYSGLLGLLLPTHPNFGNPSPPSTALPRRFAANLETGYAILKDWTTDRVELQNYIELAFANRSNDHLIENALIPQMQNNLMCL